MESFLEGTWFMELHIQGRNLELTDSTREHITRKLNRLARRLPEVSTVVAGLARQNSRSQDARVVGPGDA